jgi:hypothetical protein
VRERSRWNKFSVKKAWNIFQTTEDKCKKIQALSLSECYSMKLDLLANAKVNDAIRFVSSNKSKESRHVQENKIEEEETINNNKSSFLIRKNTSLL